MLPSLSPGWHNSQIIGKLTRKKQEDTEEDKSSTWISPNPENSQPSHARREVRILQEPRKSFLLDSGTGGLHSPPSCSKLQLWAQGSLRKMGFSCQLHQQVQVYEPLSVNSNSGSVKLFLGASKICSRLQHGILRNWFSKKY